MAIAASIPRYPKVLNWLEGTQMMSPSLSGRSACSPFSSLARSSTYSCAAAIDFADQPGLAERGGPVRAAGEGQCLRSGEGLVVVDEEAAGLGDIADDVDDARFGDHDRIAGKDFRVLLGAEVVRGGLQDNILRMFGVVAMDDGNGLARRWRTMPPAMASMSSRRRLPSVG